MGHDIGAHQGKQENTNILFVMFVVWRSANLTFGHIHA